MRIAYFSPAWPPAGAANGVVTYVALMRDHLLRHGHDVSVIAAGKLHDSDDRVHELNGHGGTPTFRARMESRIDRRLGHHPFTGRAIAGQVRRARRIAAIDLFEMEESFGWCGTVERMLDMPVVTRLHGPQFLKPETTADAEAERHARQRERAEGRAIHAARALSAPSRSTLDATCRRYHRSADGDAVIPNPVRASDATVRWHPERCDPDMILHVGRLDRLKGADLVLQAFAAVLERRPTAKLVMVGPDGGMEQPGGGSIPFVEHARRSCDPAVLARVTMTGQVAPDRIALFRRDAAMTVVASRCENFPYAAVEAMASGCPLLSTDWAGSAEIIRHGETGWLTPVGDAARMAARIAWMFDHRAVAGAAGETGRRQCGEVYEQDRVGARMTAYYRSVLDQHAARH